MLLPVALAMLTTRPVTPIVDNRSGVTVERTTGDKPEWVVKRPRWQRSFPASLGSSAQPVVDSKDGRIIIPGDTIVGLDMKGRAVWSHVVDSLYDPRPMLLVGGRIILGDGHSVINDSPSGSAGDDAVTIDQFRTVACLDPRTGNTLWKLPQSVAGAVLGVLDKESFLTIRITNPESYYHAKSSARFEFQRRIAKSGALQRRWSVKGRHDELLDLLGNAPGVAGDSLVRLSPSEKGWTVRINSRGESPVQINEIDLPLRGVGAVLNSPTSHGSKCPFEINAWPSRITVPYGQPIKVSVSLTNTTDDLAYIDKHFGMAPFQPHPWPLLLMTSVRSTTNKRDVPYKPLMFGKNSEDETGVESPDRIPPHNLTGVVYDIRTYCELKPGTYSLQFQYDTGSIPDWIKRDPKAWHGKTNKVVVQITITRPLPVKAPSGRRPSMLDGPVPIPSP